MTVKAKSTLLTLVVLSVLGAVFWAYLQPDLLFTLANQLWACF